MKLDTRAFPCNLGHATCAALFRGDRLEDLVIDTLPDIGPAAESVFIVRVGRGLKSTGGSFVTLPGGMTGYVRHGGGLVEGSHIPAQVSGYPEKGKQVQLSTSIRLKGRYVVLTPGRPGMNISRKIQDRERRAHLKSLLDATGPADTGIIARTSCGHADDLAIRDESGVLFSRLASLTRAADEGVVRLVLSGPNSARIAFREWSDMPGFRYFSKPDGKLLGQFHISIDEFRQPHVSLGGGGSMILEETRSVTCVDVNTGSDNSRSAALKTSLKAADELSRQLRIRGSGGQLIIDYPSLDEDARSMVLRDMRRGFAADPVPTRLIGWTGMGLFEIVRNRSRVPLTRVLES